MKRSWISLFSLVLIFARAEFAAAAACCGGASAAPAIIAGDDKAQFTGSYAYSEVTVDNVDDSGVWRQWDAHQKVRTLRLEGAHLLTDRWQIGGSVPIIERSFLSQNSSGLGDVAASLGYEYLPDWDYHPYRPKGIGYLQLTLPTGKARAESDLGGLDSRGNGFWALGLGTLLTKAFGRWDVFTTLEAHRSFEKKFSNSQVEGTLDPGYGGNVGWGAGYNTADWRFGGGLTWSYEDAVKLRGTTSSDGSIERYATGSLSVSYMASADYSGTLSYSDQTVFGDPINTSLGRTLALQIQKRWSR